MTLPRILLAAFAVSLAFLSAGYAAPAAPAANEDIIGRFEGTTQANVGGHPVTVVGITVLSNNKAVRLPIPNVEAKKGEKPMPKKEIDDAVKKMSVGQIVKVTVEPNKEMGTVLSTIEAYDTKPGEDTPNGYVFAKSFDKTVGKNTVTTVVLTKFGVEHNFTIAMHKGDSGQEQDPDVVAALAKITEGSGVWVQTQGKTVITAIEPYTEPQTGKMGKISEAEVDGHKVKQAEIEADSGKTVTVMVPGKEVGKAYVQDAVVLAELTKVKLGSQVEFRVHEDGDKMWLREIGIVKPVPKKPVEKEKPPAKK